MKITTEPLESHQLSVTIEVDDDRVLQGMQRAARNISKEMRIPGFRQGKAPYDVIVQRLGENAVRREAADLLAQDVVREALAEAKIDAYAPGELAELHLNPLTYKLTVPLMPSVDLGDYREFRLEPQPVEVAEEQVDEALERIREDNTVFESVDRPASWGDGIALSLVALAEDGTEVLKGDDLHLVLEAGSTDPVPGFPEAIEGMKPGEERTFALTLPEGFPQETYVGQDAQFTVTVNDVYNQIIPALDDDLARTVGSFESLDELRGDIRERMRTSLQTQHDQEYAAQVVEAITEQATVSYPPMVLERELDQVVAEAERMIQSQSRLSVDDFLRMEGKTKDELRASLEPRAVSRVRRSLVLGEVVDLESLRVDEEEIKSGIDQTSASWGSRSEAVRKSFESEAGQRAMLNRLLTDKAVRRLVAIARGEADASQEPPDVTAPDAVETTRMRTSGATDEAGTGAGPQPEPMMLDGDATEMLRDVGEPAAEPAEPRGDTGRDEADEDIRAA